MDLITQQLFGNILGMMALISGVTVGLVAIAKAAHFPSDFSGLLAVGVATGLSFLVIPASMVGGQVGLVILAGIITGLTAAGAYSAPKAIANNLSAGSNAN